MRKHIALLFSLFSLFSPLSAHFSFQPIQEQIQQRWVTFQSDRRFAPFVAGTPDAVLEAEFENIRALRKEIWKTPPYARASYLLMADLVRVPGCAAFAYNNTASYYNASTMYLDSRYYIACEGPRSKDVPSFFNLMAAHHVTHLVRLTPSYEGEQKKCHPYWEGLCEAEEGELPISTGEGTHVVHAYAITHWQDGWGIAPEELLALVLKVREEIDREEGSLLLVHCSAGVGRTGTFLAALAIVDALDRGEPLSIEEIVYRLSLQRVYSVARPAQYITLHRLAEIYSSQKNYSL